MSKQIKKIRFYQFYPPHPCSIKTEQDFHESHEFSGI